MLIFIQLQLLRKCFHGILSNFIIVLTVVVYLEAASAQRNIAGPLGVSGELRGFLQLVEPRPALLNKLY